MISFTITTFINRPTQEVFDFVTNPANAAQWKTDMVSSKYTSEGPIGVGSTFQNVGQMLGRKIVADGEITQWNPPNVWAYKATNGPAKLEETNKFESKDGGTLLIQSFQVEVGGFFKMAEGLAVSQMQKQLETHANTLKMLLESK